MTLRGGDIGRREWDAFYEFYTSTVDRKWGTAYLTRRFFSLLGERLGDAVVLMLARTPRQWVAGALNLLGARRCTAATGAAGASGRSCISSFAITAPSTSPSPHGLPRVEAGAQGEHKIQRGYLPQPTWSAHWIAHAGLRRAVAEFLDHERAEKQAEMAELATLSPFRCEGETLGAPA